MSAEITPSEADVKLAKILLWKSFSDPQPSDERVAEKALEIAQAREPNAAEQRRSYFIRLRDEFAMAALTGMLAKNGTASAQAVYDMADAMLGER